MRKAPRAMVPALIVALLACSQGASDQLDGTRVPDDGALADLARDRAETGARWLAGVVRNTGAYYYKYRPGADAYEPTEYNEVRHAGTTYSLFQLYGASGDAKLLEAAERAAGWIDEKSTTVALGRAFVFEGEAKLGGVALAIVALLERRRVTRDTARDGLIRSLATFLLSQERPKEPGRYYQFWNARRREPVDSQDSRFFPGEALLALTRLARQFPDGGYLEPAVRAAEYLVRRRDGDLPATRAIKEQDHWLTMALSELYRLRPDDGYRTVAYLHADSMRANQYTAEDGLPARIGAAKREGTINYTSTATKGEALVAAWGLARFTGDAEIEKRLATAVRRNVQFQMRVQYTAQNTQLFKRPDRAIGAWGQDAANPYIRIDFVQHNISALAGAWYLLRGKDLPVGGPV